MIKSIFNGVAEFYFLFNEQATFIICLVVAFVAFAVTLAFSIFLRGYGVKRKIYFLYFLSGVCFFDFGVEIARSGKLGYTLALIGVSVCLLSIIFSVRERQVVSEEQRELVRFIDQKINEKSQDKKVVNGELKTKLKVEENYKNCLKNSSLGEDKFNFSLCLKLIFFCTFFTVNFLQYSLSNNFSHFAFF